MLNQVRYPAKFVGMLFDQILPPRCPVSGAVVAQTGMLSPAAWAVLNFIAPPYCGCCGLPLQIPESESKNLLCGACIETPRPFRFARSAILYDDASRAMILGFKHGDQTHIDRTFAAWMQAAGSEILNDAELIIPVPLHWLRLVRRRYNQSALIAAALSKRTGIVWRGDVLTRVRHTPVQGRLNAAKRRENVARAFDVLKPDQVRGKKVVLIDDVYTTGATIFECADCLQAAGAARVDVLSVARVAGPDSMS